MRWSAIETLKDDHFSTKSDVWMFALFMFEVYTHGCWPYSELVNKETVDIMHMVVTQMQLQSILSNVCLTSEMSERFVSISCFGACF